MSKTLALADAHMRLDGYLYAISWPNDDFVIPQDPNTLNPLPFLIVEVTGGTSRPIELNGDGPAVWLNNGQVWVHVFVPVKTGPNLSFAITDDVISKFRLPPYEPIVYYEMMDDPGSQDPENGNYWRSSVTANWRLQTLIGG